MKDEIGKAESTLVAINFLRPFSAFILSLSLPDLELIRQLLLPL